MKSLVLSCPILVVQRKEKHLLFVVVVVVGHMQGTHSLVESPKTTTIEFQFSHNNNNNKQEEFTSFFGFF